MAEIRNSDCRSQEIVIMRPNAGVRQGREWIAWSQPGVACAWVGDVRCNEQKRGVTLVTQAQVRNKDNE